MSNTWEDIGHDDHLWLVEVKKSYDRRHLLEMQLKLNDSDGEKVLKLSADLILPYNSGFDAYDIP